MFKKNLILFIFCGVMLTACTKGDEFTNNEKFKLVTNASEIVSESGQVYEWGYRQFTENGKLVEESFLVNKTELFPLEQEDKIVNAVGGFRHTISLSAKGRVFTSGDNRDGQLGDGTNKNKEVVEITGNFNIESTDTIIVVAAGNDFNLALSSAGRVYSWGSNASGQLGNGSTEPKNKPDEMTSKFNLGNNDKIIMITVGQRHSLALSENGKVFNFG